jgi:hypothetical protein
MSSQTAPEDGTAAQTQTATHKMQANKGKNSNHDRGLKP